MPEGWEIAPRRATTQYHVPEPGLSEAEEKIYHHMLAAFRDEARQLAKTTRKQTRESLNASLRKYCAERSLLLEKKRGEEIALAAERELAGYGALDPLLADGGIEEVAVTGAGKPVRVFVRKQGWKETNCFFRTDEAIVETANKMASSLGRRLTYQTPRLNAVLPDGSRLHATCQPVASSGAELTIRKFRERPFSIAELVANGTLSAGAAALLWLALPCDVSLLVAGNTGSGKTTTLNSLFSFIPLDERVVVTEDTPEITIPHGHCVKLTANDENGTTLADIVRDTLRMRPDRVVIGEVRSPAEARALVDSLLSGQARGTYATFHAQSAGDALVRLESLGARPEELGALDLVLVQRRIPVYDHSEKRLKERRRVTEIALNSRGRLEALFQYDHKKDRLVQRRIKPLLGRLSQNYAMTAGRLEKELEEREKAIQALASNAGGTGFDSFTAAVQKHFIRTGDGPDWT